MLRILVADGDAGHRRLLETSLQRLGYGVVSVEDGSGALNVLLEDDGPKIALLDWGLPGADGRAVCQAVRERSADYVYMILLTTPTRRDDMLAGLEAGADDFLTKPVNASKLQARLKTGARVLELQDGLRRAQDALHVESSRDRLTGLWNRRMILDHLHRELRRAAHERRPFAVVMVDLDHFNAVNDTHGLASGDAVLKEAARRVRSKTRDYDLLGRYGGEEFLLLLPGCDATSAGQVAERLRDAIAAEPARIGPLELVVSASLGVASATSGTTGSSVLIRAADEAMLRAKSRGRNCVEVSVSGTA